MLCKSFSCHFRLSFTKHCESNPDSTFHLDFYSKPNPDPNLTMYGWDVSRIIVLLLLMLTCCVSGSGDQCQPDQPGPPRVHSGHRQRHRQVSLRPRGQQHCHLGGGRKSRYRLEAIAIIALEQIKTPLPAQNKTITPGLDCLFVGPRLPYLWSRARAAHLRVSVQMNSCYLNSFYLNSFYLVTRLLPKRTAVT